MPEIERHYLWSSAQGLNVVAIDLEESHDVALNFFKTQRLTFPVVLGGSDAFDAFEIRSIPTSVFVDSSGIVRYVFIGQMSSDEMDQALKTILD